MPHYHVHVHDDYCTWPCGVLCNNFYPWRIFKKLMETKKTVIRTVYQLFALKLFYLESFKILLSCNSDRKHCE